MCLNDPTLDLFCRQSQLGNTQTSHPDICFHLGLREAMPQNDRAHWQQEKVLAWVRSSQYLRLTSLLSFLFLKGVGNF